MPSLAKDQRRSSTILRSLAGAAVAKFSGMTTFGGGGTTVDGSSGSGSGDGDTDGDGGSGGDLGLLRDEDGKSDGDGEDDDGKSDSGGKDDDGIYDGSTDNARKRSKPDKHGHGKGKSVQKPGI
ncbi:hypothetical protein Tco_0160133 [Tanacetum coccineum]